MSGINFQWNDSLYFYIFMELKKNKFLNQLYFYYMYCKSKLIWSDVITIIEMLRMTSLYFLNLCLQSMVKKATPGRSSPVKSVSRRNTPQRGTRRSTRASKQSESSDVDDVPNDSPVTKATDHKSTENKSAKRGRNFSPEPDSKRQRVSSGNESVSDDKETDKQVCGVDFGKLWSMFCLHLGFYNILI